MRRKAVRMHNNDNVAVLVEDAEFGDEVVIMNEEDAPTVVASQKIPYGHKVALRSVKAGQPVIKYGELMGMATEDIDVGHHVHTHNVRGLSTHERGGKIDAAL